MNRVLQLHYNNRIDDRKRLFENVKLSVKYKKQPKLLRKILDYSASDGYVDPDYMLSEAASYGDIYGVVVALRLGATDIDSALNSSYNEMVFGGPGREYTQLGYIDNTPYNEIRDIMNLLNSLKNIPQHRRNTLDRKLVDKLDLTPDLQREIKRYI